MERYSENENFEQLRQIEITEWKSLLKKKRFNSIPEISGTTNSAYGINYQLKKYANIDLKIPFNCTIEHGVGLREIVCQIEVMHHVSHILTYSPFRENVIKELTDIIPVVIGPYIAYAEEYCTDEHKKMLKSRYGKVLLVMPAHSIQGIDAKYDIYKFIQKIEKIKKEFDTVMICLYWEDLKKGRWRPYTEKKYTVVSSGNPGDPLFLSRLKLILELSDVVVANAFTTGLAYGLYMNKPIGVIGEMVEFNTTKYNNSYELKREDYTKEFYELFGGYSSEITKSQRKFGNYMFGLECTKTKKEMNEILLPLLKNFEKENNR